MKDKRMKKIVIALSVLFIFMGILTYTLNGSVTGFIFYVIYQPVSLKIMNSINKRRNDELTIMWELADELELSVEGISKMSGVGIYDLKASRGENRTYLPPKKKVTLILEELTKRKYENSEKL